MSRPLHQGTLEAIYPHLFRQATWPSGPTRVNFQTLDEPPIAELIASVNLVPRLKGGWGILRLENGEWDLPGGTLEPGESYLAALRRELLEECAANLLSFRLFGAWRCLSLAEKPYRPHLPHPASFRLVGIGEIEVLETTIHPTGEERAATLEIVPLETVVKRFQSIERPDLAELYLLAAQLTSPI
jgi:8-oxo-dGTP pyrophosphatase MutT (NUDIX family)